MFGFFRVAASRELWIAFFIFVRPKICSGWRRFRTVHVITCTNHKNLTLITYEWKTIVQFYASISFTSFLRFFCVHATTKKWRNLFKLSTSNVTTMATKLPVLEKHKPCGKGQIQLKIYRYTNPPYNSNSRRSECEQPNDAINFYRSKGVLSLLLCNASPFYIFSSLVLSLYLARTSIHFLSVIGRSNRKLNAVACKYSDVLHTHTHTMHSLFAKKLKRFSANRTDSQ